MLIKEINISERPRERLIAYGKESLSNEELLSIILKNGKKGKSVKEVATEVLIKVGGIHSLSEVKKEELMMVEGIGEVKALELLSAIELGKRIFLTTTTTKKVKLISSECIYNQAKYLFKDKKQEYFYCFYLNNKSELIERKLLFMGTINRSTVHPREVFKHAYLCSASAMVCLHNHPSGDRYPSREDIRFTESLIELGKLNSIPLVDHMILTDDGYYSFYEESDIFNM